MARQSSVLADFFLVPSGTRGFARGGRSTHLRGRRRSHQKRGQMQIVIWFSIRLGLHSEAPSEGSLEGRYVRARITVNPDNWSNKEMVFNRLRPTGMPGPGL